MENLQPQMPEPADNDQPIERPRLTVIPTGRPSSTAAAAQPLWRELKEIGAHGAAFIRHLLHALAVAGAALWQASLAFLRTERGKVTVALAIGILIGGGAVHFWHQRDAAKSRFSRSAARTAVSPAKEKPATPAA